MPTEPFLTRLHQRMPDLADDFAGVLSTAEEFDFKDGDLGDDGAEALAGVLFTNTSLLVIQLAGNSISNAGAKAIAEALTVNTSLLSLDLARNNITDVSALANTLRFNETLRSLNLGRNTVSSAGAKTLAYALSVNNTLTSLNMEHTNIDGDAVRVLADVLKVNAILEELNLGGNRLGDTSVIALANALKSNKTLRSLDLSSNSISDNAAIALIDALETNTTLTSINLRGNSDITAEKQTAINSRIARNQHIHLITTQYANAFAASEEDDNVIRTFILLLTLKTQYPDIDHPGSLESAELAKIYDSYRNKFNPDSLFSHDVLTTLFNTSYPGEEQTVVTNELLRFLSTDPRSFLDACDQNRDRMILWLLRDRLADKEMQRIISFSAQKLGGAVGHESRFVSYQQLLNEAQGMMESYRLEGETVPGSAKARYDFLNRLCTKKQYDPATAECLMFALGHGDASITITDALITATPMRRSTLTTGLGAFNEASARQLIRDYGRLPASALPSVDAIIEGDKQTILKLSRSVQILEQLSIASERKDVVTMLYYSYRLKKNYPDIDAADSTQPEVVTEIYSRCMETLGQATSLTAEQRLVLLSAELTKICQQTVDPNTLSPEAVLLLLTSPCPRSIIANVFKAIALYLYSNALSLPKDKDQSRYRMVLCMLRSNLDDPDPRIQSLIRESAKRGYGIESEAAIADAISENTTDQMIIMNRLRLLSRKNPEERVVLSDTSELSDRQRTYFIALAKQFDMKPGTFTDLLFCQPKNLETIKTLAGLFQIFAKSNPEASFKYHSVIYGIQVATTDMQLTKRIRDVVAEPNKNAGLLLRIVRWWQRKIRQWRHKPSFDDQLDNLAKYFMQEAKQNEYKSIVSTTATVPTGGMGSSFAYVSASLGPPSAALAATDSDRLAAAPVSARTSSSSRTSSGHGMFESNPTGDTAAPGKNVKVHNRRRHDRP